MNGKKLLKYSVSLALETHAVKTTAGDDFTISEIIFIEEYDLVNMDCGDSGRITYLVTNNITLENPRGDINTSPGVIIPGSQVKLSAQHFGSLENPVGVNADVTYINRIQGDIDISEMWGLGSTICIRGPAPGTDSAWGAVEYNADSHLVLEAEKVKITGSDPSYIYGDITFSNLEITVPGKEIYFEAGKTYTILGLFKVQGAYAEHVKLLSSVPGEVWYIDPQGERELDYVWVDSSYNLGEEIYMTNSTNRDDSFGWDPPVSWVGGTDLLWSTGANWSGGVVPGAGDDVTINVSADEIAPIHIDVTTTVLSLAIGGAGNYSCFVVLDDNLTLTVTNNLTMTNSQASGHNKQLAVGNSTVDVGGDMVITGGTATGKASHLDLGSGTISVSGNLDIIGVGGMIDIIGGGTINVGGNWLTAGSKGVFTAGTGTINLNGTGNQTIYAGNSNTISFYNLTATTTTARTISFQAGDTFNITNNLILQGASGQLLTINSTTAATAFSINPTNNPGANASYLSVQDSNNISATVINPYYSTNVSGNTNWFPTPTILAFLVQPSNANTGATITPGVQVEVQYAGGRVNSATDSITIAIGTNPGSGTLSGTLTVSAVGGVATFSDLSINNAGTSYDLTASSGGLTGDTSSSFDIIGAVATQIAFFAQPVNTIYGDIIDSIVPTTYVQIEIQDADGNRVTSATNSVIIALGTDPTGASLSGTLTVNASAGLATFSTLTLDKVGTGYDLDATSGGLTPATSSSFNITKAPLTVTADNASKTYGDTVTFTGSEFTPTGLVNSETIGSVTLTSSGAVATADVAGSPYAITPSAATGGTFDAANYSITYTDGALTVSQAALTVTADNESVTYGDTITFTFTPTGLKNGETIGSVTYATDATTSTSGNYIVGSWTITPSAATGGTFNAADYDITYTNGSLDISKKDISAINVSATDKTYDGNTDAVVDGSSATLVGLETGDFVTVNGAAAIGEFVDRNAGTNKTVNITNLTISGVDSGNYVFTNPNATAQADIFQLAITVTADTNTKIYDGDTSSDGVPTITSGSLVTGDTATWTQTFDTKNAGAGKTLTPAGTVSDGNSGLNYDVTFTADTTGVITAAPLTVTADNASKTYGDTVTFTGSEFTPTGLVNSETIGSVTLTSSGAVATADVAGSPYAITPSAATGGTFDAANYSITYTDGALTVNQAALTVTADNTSKTYGDTVTFTGSEFTPTGLVNSETIGSVTLTSSGAVATADVAGSPYAITPSAATGGTFDAANYAITYVDGALTVNTKALTVTADSASKTYGDTVTFAGTEFTDAGLVNADDVTGVTLTSTGAAGTALVSGSPYAIVASAATGTGLSNYAITYVDGALTVNTKALTVTADSTSKTYGDTVTFAGTEFTDAGLVNADDVTGVTLTSTGAAGTALVSGSPYAIVASAATGTGLSNYAITYVDGALTVNTKALTVTADSTSKTYGDTVTFAGTEFTDSGLVNADDVTGVTLTSTGAGATALVSGSPYAIVASAATGTGLGNYTITYVDGALTVNKAPLTVTADNVTETYGDTPTFTFTPSGLKGSDSIGSVTFANHASTSTSGKDNAGTWTIRPSGATGGTFDPANYTAITYVDGALTVNPKAITVSATGIDKEADGTTAATVTLSDNRISGDVFATNYTANFISATAGLGKTVNVTGISISGTDAANYTLASTTDTTTADIYPAAASIFTIAGSGTPTAGVPVGLTLNSYDPYGNLVSFGPNNYTGPQTLTFSGANDSPLGDSPTVTDNAGTPIDFGTGTTITFTDGVATVGGSMVLYKAETANITATDGTVTTPIPLTVTVGPNVKNGLLWSPEPGTTQTVGDVWGSFSVEIIDAYGNRRTGDTDSITISDDGTGTFGGTTTQPSVGGVATFGDITYSIAGSINVTGSSGTLADTPPAGPITVTGGEKPEPEPEPEPPVWNRNPENDYFKGVAPIVDAIDDLVTPKAMAFETIITIGNEYGFNPARLIALRPGGSIYPRWYLPGAYRVIVTVYSGKSVEAPYDEKGPDYKRGVTLSRGEEVTRELVIEDDSMYFGSESGLFEGVEGLEGKIADKAIDNALAGTTNVIGGGVGRFLTSEIKEGRGLWFKTGGKIIGKRTEVARDTAKNVKRVSLWGRLTLSYTKDTAEKVRSEYLDR